MTEVVTQPGLLETLGLNGSLFIAQLINFALVLWIANKWIFKPLISTMDERQQKIKQGLDDAAEAKERLENAEGKARSLVTEAKKESQGILEASRQQAEEERKHIQAETTESLERQLEEARQRLKADKEAMMQAMKKDVSDLIVTATGKVGLAVSGDKQIQQDLISQSIEQLEQNV